MNQFVGKVFHLTKLAGRGVITIVIIMPRIMNHQFIIPKNQLSIRGDWNEYIK